MGKMVGYPDRSTPAERRAYKVWLNQPVNYAAASVTITPRISRTADLASIAADKNTAQRQLDADREFFTRPRDLSGIRIVRGGE